MSDFEIIQTGVDAKSGVASKCTRSLLLPCIRVHLAIKTREDLEKELLSILVTLVMDLSGSMQGDGETSEKEALRTIQNVARTKLTNHAFFGTAIGFSSDARLLAGANAPIALKDFDKKVTDELSSQIFASGGTNMDAALELASQHVKHFQKGHDASVVVLMTDGQPTLGSIFDAATLRSRFESSREERREYIVPLAMGRMATMRGQRPAEFLSTLAGGETFVCNASELEQVPDALAKGLAMFNEALCLFDVEVEVRRAGEVVWKTVLNKGFVTPRHDTVLVDLDFQFEPQDELTVVYPGGVDTILVQEGQETGSEIWKEVATAKVFEEKLEEIKMSGLGLKAGAEALRNFTAASDPVHRSLSARTNTMYRALSTAPEPPASKRAAVGAQTRSVQRFNGSEQGTFRSLVAEKSHAQYRSMVGPVGPYASDEEDLHYRSTGGGSSGEVQFEAKHAPPDTSLEWEALVSQSGF